MPIIKTTAGKQIKCKWCDCSIAWISLEEGHYRVVCPECGAKYDLANQHKTK